MFITMKKITNKIFGTLVVAVMAFATVSTAFAGSVSWARPNQSPYGTIGNVVGTSEVNSKVYGASNYVQTSTASAGDRVAVLVYFHNDGTANSNNTIIKLDRPSSSAARSFTLGGSVSGGGASLSGTTTINLSSSQTLTFIPGSLRVSYDQGRTDTGVLANETDIFNGGLDIGLVRAMTTCASNALCAQGSVALGFQVSNTSGGSNGSAPTVLTGSYTPFSETAGYATLQGSVSPNGAAACSYFKYRNTTASSWETTSENCLSQSTGNYAIPSAYISGLSGGTYEYQACARNSSGTTCGIVKTFVIAGPAAPKQCNDGIDNDGDGLTDYPNDPGCDSPTDNNESPYNTVPQCVINSFTASPSNVSSGGYTTLSWSTTNCDYVTVDGVSYGVDGSGPFGPLYTGRNYELKAWKSSTASNPQTRTVYVGVTGTQTYQCNDGIDNDGDGYTDYPNDPACYSPTDNTESPYNTSAQCVIDTFTGSPSNVSNGGYTTLSWATTNCDNVTVDGVSYGVDGSGPFGPLYSGRSYELRAWKNGSSSNQQTRTVYIGVTGSQTYQCNDGYDNDGDGYTDYPNDPSCYGPTDDSESPYDGNNNYSNLYVTTDNYSWINQDTGSIVLRGRYSGNTYGSTRTYFEYRLNGQSARTITSDISTNNSLSFNVSLYNLSQGSYEYRACASNNYAQCGSWLPFYVNQTYSNPNPTNNSATVQTLNPIQYSSTFATLDGYYNMNGCSGATYFEYGPNGNYGYTTTPISRSISGSMAQSVTNLIPGTTYYYRAVAQNCGGIVRGDARQFTTTNQTIRDNTPVVTGGGNTTIIRNITTATNIGGGAQYIRLTIDNGRDTIIRGDELIYDVTWENISKKDLNDLVLEVSFPEGLKVTYADRGQIDRKANTVYVNIKELRALEKDDMTIRARVTGSFKENDPITARAIIAFENPENKAQENAIAYDSDTFLSSTNVLGASVFGLDFLSGTLAGWLFIILLLILLILIIRYATRGREEHHHYYPTDRMPGGPTVSTTPVVPMGSTTTTTEVEYTPYRPTPRN